jgi:hypothetical protein
MVDYVKEIIDEWDKAMSKEQSDGHLTIFSKWMKIWRIVVKRRPLHFTIL